MLAKCFTTFNLEFINKFLSSCNFKEDSSCTSELEIVRWSWEEKGLLNEKIKKWNSLINYLANIGGGSNKISSLPSDSDVSVMICNGGSIRPSSSSSEPLSTWEKKPCQ